MTRRKIIFLAVFFILQLSLIWPIYSFFAGVFPLIFGLPLSFAWIVFILISCFLLLLWYYFSDPALKSGQPNDR